MEEFTPKVSWKKPEQKTSFWLKKWKQFLPILWSLHNWENCEHQKYFWNVIVVQEKNQSGVRKLNYKQECWLVCGSVACPHVLIFAVIGRNTINIPEMFQVFTVFPVAL